MKNKFLYITPVLLLIVFISCKKKSEGGGGNDDGFTGVVTTYPAAPVQKTQTKKIFAHVMPWFETPETYSGQWGSHWTMTNQNPNIIGSNGQRQIASHYYPLTGPYASGDTAIIEYQLMLMKLSGIDGVFIDWPGRQVIYDYPYLVRNTEKIVSILGRVGLNYAIVYEDQNLAQAGSNKISQGQTDMLYLQSKFFPQSNYEKISGNPLLLVFGPQVIQNANGLTWSSIFSVLSTQPAFFTLWGESGEAGGTATGEFAWVYRNNKSDLVNFYNKSFSGVKMASAYPGFNSFYAQGGSSGPTWTISYDDAGMTTFQATLDLALNTSLNYVQLTTWNDYGEGTMIEPTVEYQYSFLTTLQQKLGVSSLGEDDLKMIKTFYDLRKSKAGDDFAQKKLNQVFYYIVSLQLDKAKALLAGV